MTAFIPFVVIAIVVFIAFFLQGKTKYYNKVFSDEHYTEIVQWLHSVLQLGPVSQPHPDDTTAFYSSAKCTFTFTRAIEDSDMIHIDISQMRAPTTHDACERLASIIIQTLNQNKADFYYTETNIHHLLFAKEVGGEWLTNDAATVLPQMKTYERPPFHFQSTRDSP